MKQNKTKSVDSRHASLARWVLGTAEFEAFQNIPSEVLAAICDQGLAGQTLANWNFARMDEVARHRLQAGAARVGAENIQAMNETARVAAAFQDQRLPLLLLKGAALNLSVYSRLDLRPMSDIDMLVPPDEAQRAIRIFQRLGYRRGAALLRDDFFPSLYYETEMILPGSRPVRVDLHAHPFRPMQLSQVISTESFWKDPRSVSFNGVSVLLPSLEVMFVHLCAHAAFHGCSRLTWLLDLKHVVKSGAQMDWDKVAAIAGEWQLCLAVRSALLSAESALGCFCPTAFLDRLALERASWRERITLRHTPRDAASPLLHVACNLACLRGMRAKTSYLAALLRPQWEHLAESYPHRHFAWTWCAQATRAARTLARFLALPLRTLKILRRQNHGDLAW